MKGYFSMPATIGWRPTVGIKISKWRSRDGSRYSNERMNESVVLCLTLRTRSISRRIRRYHCYDSNDKRRKNAWKNPFQKTWKIRKYSSYLGENQRNSRKKNL